MKFLSAAIALCACTLTVAVPINVQPQAVTDVFVRDIESAPAADIDLDDAAVSGSLEKRVLERIASPVVNRVPQIVEAVNQKTAGEVMGAVLGTGKRPGFMRPNPNSPTAEIRKGRPAPMTPTVQRSSPLSPARAPHGAMQPSIQDRYSKLH